MSKASIALVTAVAARHLDEDLPPLESALRNAGAKVTVAEWDRPHDWSRSDIALLRSTWDYTQRLPEFFAWARKVAGKTTLLNPLPVVKWNSDKHYLRNLADKGVSTVPSSFIEPGENAHLRIADLLSDPAKLEEVVRALGQTLLFDGRGRQVLDFAFGLRGLRPESLVLVGLPGGSVGSGGAYRGERLEPNGARALAVRVEPDRLHLTVYVAAVAMPRVLPDLEANGQIAISFGRPEDDRACQVKGFVVGTRPAAEDERLFVAAQFDGYQRQLEKIGIARRVVAGWSTWPAAAITVKATALFEQTPGPGAGAPIA